MLGASLLTPRQVATILRCSRSEVHLLIACGELPSVFIGRRPRVPESGLRAWMAQRPTSRRPGRS